MRQFWLVLLCALCLLAGVTTGKADGPVTHLDMSQRIYGVMSDDAEDVHTKTAKRNMNLVCRSGFNTVKQTVWIHLKQHNPSYRDTVRLDQSIRAAETVCPGTKLMLALWPKTWGQDGQTPPLRPSQQRMFCDFGADLLKKYPQIGYVFVGNEINNPLFWRSQFKPDGTDAVSAPYESLLATCYDRLKRANPSVAVIGLELAARGNDDANSGRPSHSPEVIIKGVCKAYRDSGRTRPIMDWIGMHPYGADSSEPPDSAHSGTTIGLADYNRLQQLLQCFRGTAQPVPLVLWSEYGVETTVPSSQKPYKGKQPTSASAVDETTQGRYYAKAINMAACQPKSVGLIIFHTIDEPGLGGWQSGLYYSPKRGQAPQPKQSQPQVRSALQSAEAGTMHC